MWLSDDRGAPRAAGGSPRAILDRDPAREAEQRRDAASSRQRVPPAPGAAALRESALRLAANREDDADRGRRSPAGHPREALQDRARDAARPHQAQEPLPQTGGRAQIKGYLLPHRYSITSFNLQPALNYL